MATDAATPDGSSDDIEAEANNYFHQMFSGQLSIEAIVQMLARFKESSDKRCTALLLEICFLFKLHASHC